jgi:hypothetical protein
MFEFLPKGLVFSCQKLLSNVWSSDFFQVHLHLIHNCGVQYARGRPQWPRGLGHELSSLALTLGSWVRIPFKAWMFVLCAFILCVGRGLATG